MTSSPFNKSKSPDNKYMLGDEIGKGAYARVYKGLDLKNGDFVAIKQVSLENVVQDDDLNTIMNLNHKNIVKYLGSWKTKTHLHIILEYVENGSLANNVKPNKFGPFPESLVAVYIAQGLVKLADFGVATKLNESEFDTNSVVGSPYWMAPEVIELIGVCAASDIWSVGCTVIELLTCVPPYFDMQPSLSSLTTSNYTTPLVKAFALSTPLESIGYPESELKPEPNQMSNLVVYNFVMNNDTYFIFFLNHHIPSERGEEDGVKEYFPHLYKTRVFSTT
ncbi:hypothetical protein DY000_02043226 [Brassica cretica]|uniref:non-specific serine/threonine protein kinase n=1 Tax=Brassica cretica TaxID=69181 RepID=A0ABQ7BMU9_BRACR|nr:hypothetical protein DY000_02043226 [Brassica cretica]